MQLFYLGLSIVMLTLSAFCVGLIFYQGDRLKYWLILYFFVSLGLALGSAIPLTLSGLGRMPGFGVVITLPWLVATVVGINMRRCRPPSQQ
ncbi:MAG TPA: hypothetical protein VLE93_03045 [Candidatus Saccharimonadales bacterium]|nr:hypothetical protein [Candidatus Saccharimonadales bacterium]